MHVIDIPGWVVDRVVKHRGTYSALYNEEIDTRRSQALK
jgi:hypothetical protein